MASLLRGLLSRPRRFSYGPARSQKCDFYGREGAPVVILVHGGSWQARYGKWVMRLLVADLVNRGWAVWNVEYRRVGEEGGGWPGTFEDVVAAVDRLGELTDEAVIVGHSAGGQLALHAAGAARRVRITAAVSQAGVVALRDGHAGDFSGPVHAVVGGAPDEVPDRYAAVDPVARVPLPLPVLLVHGTEDTTVPIKRSRRYAQAARAAGGDVELVEVAGEAGLHRAHVDPRGEAWAVVTGWLERQAGGTA